MLTVFSIRKLFLGHIGVIQRNALGSWTRLSEVSSNIAIETGQFRHVDITRARFDLPPPRQTFPDAPVGGEPRYIGVWRRKELSCRAYCIRVPVRKEICNQTRHGNHGTRSLSVMPHAL